MRGLNGYWKLGKEPDFMTFVYPAVFTPATKDGKEGFEGYFPDLEIASLWGQDLEDAVDNARFAAEGWIEDELRVHNGVPDVTHEEDIEVPENGVVRKVMVHVHMLPDSD